MRDAWERESMNETLLFTVLDMAGTFAFAISGAVAARQKNLDLFGIIAIAYMVACGGGIIRDVCIGAIPPAGLADWRYLTLALIAAALAMVAYPLLQRLDHPVQMFDALGLSFFAVFGAHKALLLGHNAQVAIVLGIVSAVGGGAMRDVLLNRTPLILRKEIYASAALLAAVVQVTGERLGLTMEWVPWVGILLCFGLRYLAMRHGWNLPRFAPHRKP
jgi:uncharacterized membrane protein YeiH